VGLGFFACFLVVVLGLELGALGLPIRHSYHLTCTSSPLCSNYFGDGDLMNYLSILTSNFDPPDLSLPSN
jgi:hypothetical protein